MADVRQSHRLRKNDLVAVTFLDHSEGDEAILFTVCGRLLRQTRDALLVGVWVYADPRRKVEVAHNVHTYTIIRSAIRKAVKLEPAKHKRK